MLRMMAGWVNIANLFTLARLAAIPFAVEAILTGERMRALVIVLVAGLTDAVDGALARRFGMITRVGAYFDPIVDKLFLSAIYIAMAAITQVPWWLVIEIFTRDILILAASGVLLLRGKRRFPPSIWGKVSTFLQIALALVVLIQDQAPDPMVWAVAAVTALSGIHYLLTRATIDGGLARE